MMARHTLEDLEQQRSRLLDIALVLDEAKERVLHNVFSIFRLRTASNEVPDHLCPLRADDIIDRLTAQHSRSQTQATLL